MGTPDTVYFKCPNCGKQMFTQIRHGCCSYFQIEKMCECDIEKFERNITEETCPDCKYVITFEINEGYKKVKLLKPVIKT